MIIRPFVPEDAREIHEIYADPELTHRIIGRSLKSLEDTHRLLARLIEHQRMYGFSLWAMIGKENGRIIGDCGLLLVQNCWPEVEFTYHLSRPYWCKGYAKEATAECLRFGFEQLNFERIISVLIPDDPVSARMLGVMEKAGMSYMGTGWFHDQEMSSMRRPGKGRRRVERPRRRRTQVHLTTARLWWKEGSDLLPRKRRSRPSYTSEDDMRLEPQHAPIGLLLRCC